MIAQQIQKDFNKVKPLIKNVEPINNLTHTATARRSTSENSHSFSPAKALATQSAFFKTSDAETDNVYVKEVKEKFAQYTIEDEKRLHAAKNILDKFNTASLIAAYHFALNNLVGDDIYLKNRPMNSAQEHDNFIMLNALTNQKWLQKDEAFLRAELIHALAREAWRNPVAYQALVNYQPMQNTTQSSEQLAEQPVIRQALKVG